MKGLIKTLLTKQKITYDDFKDCIVIYGVSYNDVITFLEGAQKQKMTIEEVVKQLKKTKLKLNTKDDEI